MIPETFIEELMSRSSIEDIVSGYTKLSRKGNKLHGLCPFHSEKTGSFFVYLDNQSYYCFGCGAGGGLINFVMKSENLTYIEAIRLLAQKAGMTLPDEHTDDQIYRTKTKILEINRESAHYYHNYLVSPSGKYAYDYLINRGRTHKIIRRFGLGYAPTGWDSVINHLRGKGFSYQEMVAAGIAQESRKKNEYYDRFYNRIIFPIIDLRGNVVGFGGRSLNNDSGPKYLNTGDTIVFKKSRNLYALNFSKTSKASSIILAEGYMDVIAIHQAGFDNAVATLGTSLTEEQARILSQYTDSVILAYDSDGAGQNATKRAINIFDKTGVKVNILEMDGAKDPDEFIKAYGPTKFQMLIEGSSNAIEFGISKLRKKYNLDEPSEKVSFLKEFCKLISDIRNPIEREVYVSKICTELQVSASALRAQIQSISKYQERRQVKKQRSDTKIYIGEMAAANDDIQRRQNLKYAILEEEIIRTLIQNPDFYKRLKGCIGSSDFVTNHNQVLFATICSRLDQNKKIGLEFLAEDLLPEDQARLAAIMAVGIEKRSDWNSFNGFIRSLKEFKDTVKDEDVAEMETNQLKDYIKSLADKKN